jgi:predicted nucleotidyltransferase
MIEKILPGTETKLKILKMVYENPEINLTELIRKTGTSPNMVLEYVNTLVGFGILNEKRLGGRKKVHIRNFRANLSSHLSALIFSFVEIEKRLAFLKKYRELNTFVNQLTELFDGSIESCLIYGSFARFSADKESDLDIWIIGNPGSEMKKRISEIFSTMKREYSIKIETAESFSKNINDSIHQNIAKDHVVVCNEINFLRILSGTNKIN